MSYQTNSINFIDNEERIIREYEQELANEDVIDIKKLNLKCDKKYRKSINNNDKFDKCLNISDDEYLQTINQLDDNRIKLINTSIPNYFLDNLNKNEQRKLNKLKSTNLIDNLDNYLDNNSILNSLTIQSNDLLNNNFINCLSNKSISSNSSDDNLLKQQNLSSNSSNTSINFKNKKSIIIFESINAKSVLSNINNSTKRFIVYTIILKRTGTGHLDTKPGIIEKRYSDFHRFYLQLRKHFPLSFEQYPFPKKIYSNNFEANVIFERSNVFQDLLNDCLSIKELRTSSIFYDFILHPEFKKCLRLLRTNQFEESIINLENLNFILFKLNEIESSIYLGTNLFITYLAISACYNQIEQYEDAANYADNAFKMILFNNDFDTNELIVPFLLLSVQLNSRLSRDCKAQNDKLLELNDKKILFDKSNQTDNLIDLFILKNYFLFNP